MRNFKFDEQNQIRVKAISGHYVIFLGIDLNETLTNNLLGFSIKRTDHQTNRVDYLQSMKVFKSVIGTPTPGLLVSTEFHPIQDFNWSDFTVKPNNGYTYTIQARGGTPNNLVTICEVSVDIQTESVNDTDKHKIFFNRGVAGSQAFSRKFDPDNKLTFKQIAASKPWVFDWLSRGLKEALFSFIQKATNNNFKIRASIYECSYEPALSELKAAQQRGVDVEIIVHYNEKDQSKLDEIQSHLQSTGVLPFTTLRKNPGDISHNKFFILIENNVPKEIWTGSTNISTGGIFGHSNVGHQLADNVVATKYLTYWEQLKSDPLPRSKVMQNEDEHITPNPSLTFVPPNDSINVFFSPRNNTSVLDWYANFVDTKKAFTFITFPFGIDTRFEQTLIKIRENPIYVITDKAEKKTASGKGLDVATIRSNPFNLYAFGDMLKNPNTLEKWLKERLSDLNVNVRYIHTKYIIIDPISENPIVITGSANFSENSIIKNDENTLVITDDKRVADIYFVEFFRLFRHFYFRNLANETSNPQSTNAQKSRIFLNEDSAWVHDYYANGNVKSIIREYFSKAI